MMTFRYQTDRLQRIDVALKTADVPDDLRARIEREQSILAAGDWRSADRTYETAAVEIIWRFGPDVQRLIREDAVIQALQADPALSEQQSAAIDQLPRHVGPPPAGFFRQIAAAVGDETALGELVQAAQHTWLMAEESPGYLFDDVGVLLPLRLETLFDPPQSAYNDDAARWQLSLRVIPDEASICRDNSYVGDDERLALTLYYRALGRQGESDPDWLLGDDARVAWQQLCQRVTPARAAWLVANVAVAVEGDEVQITLPDGMPDAAQGNRVGGLPPELQIVLLTTAAAGSRRIVVGRLPQQPDKRIDPLLKLPMPGNVDGEVSWLTDWEAAQAVGLGGIWHLPEGVTPDTIDVLYVAGIGDQSPELHFRSQIDAGELSLLPLGTPTNSVHGAATDVYLGADDWLNVARMRLRQRLNLSVPSNALYMISRYLLGTGSTTFFPGADGHAGTIDSQQMVAALWPALWGHWLTDLWQFGDKAHLIAHWALDYLCPEGPLLPIRIADQPYALLPVTALSRWQPAAGSTGYEAAQRRLEARLAAHITVLRDEFARIARPLRSAVNGDTTNLMRLIAQDAQSARYIWRHFIPAWAGGVLYDPNLRDEVQAVARSLYAGAQDFLGSEIVEPYVANGYWRQNRLPLVQPRRMLYRHRNGEERERLPLARLIELLGVDLRDYPVADYDLENVFSQWWVLDQHGEYQLGGLPDSLLIRLLVYATQIATVWRKTAAGTYAESIVERQLENAFALAEQLDDPAWHVDDENPYNQQPIFALDIPAGRRRELEHALRATLDSAAQRIDPWVTGFAWQRLATFTAGARGNFRLGAYGWVNGPFTGTPGPTDWGRLHTPSYNQTIVALILRDKFVSSGGLVGENGRNPWAMSLTASKVRLAEAIAEEVRLGFHIYEVIGRFVENVIADHQTIKRLRLSAKYAMRPERNDPNAVCNGNSALTGLLANDPDFALSGEQLDALQLLQDALDTYSDLLIADGVMQIVNRQPERAAATMDAAAGFSKPPTFEFIRTPPSGYQLETVVLSVLPFVAADGLPPDASPIALADPSVAAFLQAALGSDWQWQALDGETVVATVDLAAMGLSPVDTLALAPDVLRDVAAQMLQWPATQIKPPEQQRLAQQLVQALGNRPAVGRDLTDAAADNSVRDDLRQRYSLLRASCTQLIDQLENAAGDDARIAWVRRALAWGVTPLTEPAQRATFLAALANAPLPEEGMPLAELAASIAATLARRLAAAPTTADTVQALTEAITALAAPQAKLTILARWHQQTLREMTDLTIDQPDETLDELWLTEVAATRPALARLEALQLEASLLASWSNSPGDPWQQRLILQNQARRDADLLAIEARRFVAAYGSAASWQDDADVAAGLIDAFSEAIPLAQRSTSAAIGFNAPAARPPQAILLAVPPAPGQRLDNELVIDIVAETRTLTHARTARIEDLGEFAGLLPSMWLQASGPTRVRLEPHPLFER